MRTYVRAVVICIVFCGVWPILQSASALGPVDGRDLVPTDLERVLVGAVAPDFNLEDEQGNPLTLSQFRDKKNVVLVFYRGHW